MRKWAIRLGVLAVLVVAGLALRMTVLAADPITVRAVAVERGRVEATVTNSRAGTVRARNRAELSPEISGRVIELPKQEGDRVEQGELLVRLDDQLQRARLELARRSLGTAEALYTETCVSARRAQRELERNRKLADDQIISEDVLDRVQSGLDVAEAACDTAATRVEQARAEITMAEVEVERTRIVAPFTGVLAERAVELGEWITPSPPGLPMPSAIDLLDPTSIYVSAPMDEVDLAVIEAGQRVRVTIDPYPDREFAGKVVRIAPYVLDLQEQNRTVEIEVELDDREVAGTLLPGTSADVEVILEVREDVPRVPTSTLLEGSRVLVLEGGMLVEREVEVGIKNWDWVEIRGGLAEGESVVTTLGRVEVRPGVEAVLEDALENGGG